MNEIINCTDCISGRALQLELSDQSIRSASYTGAPPAGDIYCGPGLTDLQVNGFAGVDFNTYPIDENHMLNAIHALSAEGVSTFYPTIITNSDEAIIALLKNIDQLCSDNPVISRHIGGIHLEGPFISAAEGARGAHDPRFIKAPDWELFMKFQKASGNRIRILTLCPQWEAAPSFISRCVEDGVIVAIGHTDAAPESIRAAVDAGASLSTHLGNGAPLLLPRNSSFIFEQLAQDQLYTSLIADGFHLPDSFLKIALKMKQDQAILVSDSTRFAGMESGTYNSHIGGKVVLEPGGRLSMHSDKRLLAGAALSLVDGVNHLLRSGLAELPKAWSAASINPESLLGSQHTGWSADKRSDLVLFKLREGEVSIMEVFKQGTRISGGAIQS